MMLIVVFVSNYYNHHQSDFSDAMNVKVALPLALVVAL